ncbi:MAG: HPr family phosphocarrier protein, partial [Candidatus Riflebacteria bacterium]|nr:HPr family phosphocarrier protein [Candidatus Riflebacteria bacterium]
MKRKEVEIRNKLGLHARPASLVVKLAGKFES